MEVLAPFRHKWAEVLVAPERWQVAEDAERVAENAAEKINALVHLKNMVANAVLHIA
jgi:hypothetical protein